MTGITRKQADDLVDDLVFAYRDQDVVFPDSPSYLEEYFEQRERMVTTLLTGMIPGAGCKADDTEAARGGDTDGGRTAGSSPATGASSCDVCGATDVEVSRAWVTGIETFACDKCRRVEEEQSDPGALWFTREKDGRMTIKVRTPDDVTISAVSIPEETWAELIAPHIPRSKSGPIFECPDCGKDIADCTEPHDDSCGRLVPHHGSGPDNQ